MLIKIDFDLTKSILAHNLYRLFSNHLECYSRLSDPRIDEAFVNNYLIFGDKIRRYNH